MTSSAVVTLTLNPAVDVGVTVDHVRADVKLRCSQPSRRAGGGGLNAARVVARLGGRVVAVHTHGGLTGSLLTTLLREEGLAARPVEVAGETRENVVVVERTTRRHFHLVMPGPQLSPSESDRCLDAVLADADGGYVVASGSLPPGAPDDLYARLAERVRGAGGRLVLDTAGEPLRRALEVGVWMIKPNVRELADLTGIVDSDEAALERAARGLIDAGSAELVVLSLGAGGAYAVARGRPAEHLRAPIVPIHSRVGAGDSMVGAMAYGASMGMDVAETVRLGVAAGAAAVLQEGSEVCRAEDVWRLLARLRGE